MLTAAVHMQCCFDFFWRCSGIGWVALQIGFGYWGWAEVGEVEELDQLGFYLSWAEVAEAGEVGLDLRWADPVEEVVEVGLDSC